MFRVAVQMDEMSGLDLKGDSTFALMLEAQKRGFELARYGVETLSLRDGRVTAWAQSAQVFENADPPYILGATERVDLADYDIVLMRQDPPFDMAYISATHILERLQPKVLVVNDPAEVRNAPEKIFVTEFADLMPPTLITRAPREVHDFRREFGDIIVKPLYGNGGAGVFHITETDENLSSLLEMLETSNEPFIAQAYLSDVREGDKRIILIEGEAVGAINRVPPPLEARSNMHIGGEPQPTEISEAESEICARIGPELKKRGFVFVGIDVIGGKLTEINVTSPTGIREVKKFGGADIAALFWDAVAQKRESAPRKSGTRGTRGK